MKSSIDLFIVLLHKAFSLFWGLLVLGVLLLGSCTQAGKDTHEHDSDIGKGADAEEHAHGAEGAAEEVHLKGSQVAALELRVDTIPLRNMSAYVEANGQLGLFPQNQAVLTSSVGANVASIEVIEGRKVSKGQVLAWLSHPDLLQWQMEYSERWHRLPVVEQEYLRQKALYEQGVGAAKVFQQVESSYRSLKAELKGYEARLRMLGMEVAQIQQGHFYERIPLRSPISGYVRRVFVKTGQYVQPETELLDIVNNDRIHVDLMVFEKDMYKVRKGQKVKFYVEVLPGEELEAEIYAVGKAFEQDPKALHLHAEIQNKKGLLIPGTYVRARILTEDVRTYALPESGLVREGEKYYFFVAEEPEEDEGEWHFQPVEAIAGIRNDGWVEVRPLVHLPKGSKVVMNNAYYLLAEMKKGEAGHDH